MYTDIFELSRARATLTGEFDDNDLPQLRSLLTGDEARVRVSFHAQGTAGRDDLPGADLELDAHIVTACVRCGKPVHVHIEKTVPFLFAHSERQANEMPIEDDEQYEIVVGSRKFDVVHWVEEELILSLPTFAEHDDCEPDPEQLHTEESPETLAKPNPFACLAALKTNR